MADNDVNAVADLINQITADNFSQANVSFADIMNTKVGDALDLEKIALGPTVFGEPPNEVEDDYDYDEEEDIDISDEEIEDYIDDLELDQEEEQD